MSHYVPENPRRQGGLAAHLVNLASDFSGVIRPNVTVMPNVLMLPNMLTA